MTSTRPSAIADSSLAGPHRWSVRSALAPRPLSRAVVLGVLAELLIGALDVALRAEIVIAALLVVPPLLVGLAGRWGDTAVVAVLALTITVASPLWNEQGGTAEWAVPLLVVLAGDVVAMAVALVRTRSAIELERFRLLMGVAEAGDDTATAEGLVERVMELLIPALTDACSVDAMVQGRHRRLGARAAVPSDPSLQAALDRRKLLPAEDPRSPARAMVRGETTVVAFDRALLREVAGREGDEAQLARAGIRAAVHVPLRARGRVIGALSLGLGPSGRAYSGDDVRFAEVLAGRVALALDNAGLTSELNVAEQQLGAVVRELAEAVTVTDTDGQIVYANAAAVALLRAGSVEELLSSPPGEVMDRFAVYDEDGRPVGLQRLPAFRVLAGEEDAAPLLVRNVVKATGEERWLLNKVSCLRDDDGRLLRVVNVIEDVTSVKRAERAQRLLARASEALAASLDYGETLQHVADVAVPALADWAAVDLPGRGGRIDQVAVAHGDPAKVLVAQRLRERYPVHVTEDNGLAAAVREGRSELQPVIAEEMLVAYADDPEHLRLLREVGFGSLMIVPLHAGAESLGALTFVNSDPVRRFGQEDLELAQELGRRAGVAVLNARLYSRRSAIATALQHGLLPPELPEVPGWETAALYRPAGELNEVGGDFYDVFRGPDGWMLVIGDIAGKGAEAATRTSLARFTTRTAAELTGDPGRAVLQLNETLRSQPGLPLATVVCACLTERGDGTARLAMASAGHPPPLLVRGDAVSPLGRPGTIAGAFDGETWPVATVELVPGDVLVFYTDGVLDAVGEHDRFGEERLHELVAGLGGSVEDRLNAINARLQAFQRGPQRDDTTVLVLEWDPVRAPTGADRGQAGELSR